jgi:hypothetical protein
MKYLTPYIFILTRRTVMRKDETYEQFRQRQRPYDRVRSRRYYQTHKEEKRAYNAAHKEERRVYNAAYYQAHREEQLIAKAAYNAAHKEEKRAYDAARYQKSKLSW